jgi:hypothetical protein
MAGRARPRLVSYRAVLRKPESEHELAFMAVLADGTSYRRCACGWESPLLADHEVLTELLEAHIAARATKD